MAWPNAIPTPWIPNYLSAYWAGVSAHKLKKTDEALQWIDKALAINPDYKPAQDFKSKTLKK